MNNQRFTITEFDDRKVVIYDDNEEHEVIVDRAKFLANFRPSYACTVWKAQGLTISEKVHVYQSALLGKHGLYTAFTRVCDPSLLTIVERCNIQKRMEKEKEEKNRMKELSAIAPDESKENTMLIHVIKTDPKIVPFEKIYFYQLELNGKLFYRKREDALRWATGKEILISREIWLKDTKDYKHENSTYCYTTFYSYDEYYKFVASCSESERTFHEVIRSSQERKLYIDYDKHIAGDLSTTGKQYIMTTIAPCIEKLAVDAAYESFGIRTSAKVFNNTRHGKISFHIVLDNITGDSVANKQFATEFKAQAINFNSDWITARNSEIDMSVYDDNHTIRCAGSCKMKDGVAKEYVNVMMMDFEKYKITQVKASQKLGKTSTSFEKSLNCPSALAKEIKKYGLTFQSVNGTFGNVVVPRGACVKCNVVHNQSYGGVYFLNKGGWKLRCKHEGKHMGKNVKIVVNVPDIIEDIGDAEEPDEYVPSEMNAPCLDMW